MMWQHNINPPCYSSHLQNITSYFKGLLKWTNAYNLNKMRIVFTTMGYSLFLDLNISLKIWEKFLHRTAIYKQNITLFQMYGCYNKILEGQDHEPEWGTFANSCTNTVLTPSNIRYIAFFDWRISRLQLKSFSLTWQVSQEHFWQPYQYVFIKTKYSKGSIQVCKIYIFLKTFQKFLLQGWTSLNF